MKKAFLSACSALFVLISSGCSETQVKDTINVVGQEISDTAARITASAVSKELQDKATELMSSPGSLNVIEQVKKLRTDITFEYSDGNGDGLDDDGKITIVVGSGRACIDLAAGVTSGPCN